MSKTGSESAHRRIGLVRFDYDTARAILNGDLGVVRAAADWPHDGTVRGPTMMVEHGTPLGWRITLNGSVIGDCGAHGPPDGGSTVEIGYGLAEPLQGYGYGTGRPGAVSTRDLSWDFQPVPVPVAAHEASRRRREVGAEQQRSGIGDRFE